MSKRFVTLVVVAAIVFGLVGVSTAKAATIEELEALIAQLRAEIAALSGGAAATPSASVFTKDLTIGSQGDQVEALQQYLIDEGYLDWDGALGYFGNLTKAALAAWQADNGVSPAAGYWGPISRAMYADLTADAEEEEEEEEAEEETTTPGITTPGVEGTLSVSANPTPSAGLTVREGDSQKKVLGLKLEAKLSDIDVQRVKVDLGSSTVFYNKLFNKIYLMDGDTVLAESDLNSSTVVKESSTYYITLAGFHYIVPKNSTKVLTLALDANSSIDSTYKTGTATYGLAVPAYGIRGVDGAGINQTAASAISRRAVIIGANAADNATLSIAKDVNSPVAASVIADQGTNDNEKDGVTLVIFRATAQKDDVLITSASTTIAKTGSGTATATTAYLYVSGEDDPIGTATPDTSTGVATFSDIDYTIPAGETKTFTVKVDIRQADTTAAYIRVSAVNVLAENSEGTRVVPTGSVSGENMTVLKEGLELSLVSKSLSPVSKVVNQAGTVATSSVTGTFVVKVKAIGSDVLLGAQASSAPMFASSTDYFQLYNGNTAVAGITPVVSFSLPTQYLSGTTATIPNGTEVLVQVTANFTNRSTAGAALTTDGLTYAIGMKKVVYDGASAATFMEGNTDWITEPVALPLN